MGQTQLLLVILGVLLVGVAIYVGFSMFQQNAAESNRSAVIKDLQGFAAQAQVYYRKSISQAGGGKSFEGITIAMVCPAEANENARYSIQSVASNECVILGVGMAMSDDDSVRVRIRVSEARNVIEILN